MNFVEISEHLARIEIQRRETALREVVQRTLGPKCPPCSSLSQAAHCIDLLDQLGYEVSLAVSYDRSVSIRVYAGSDLVEEVPVRGLRTKYGVDEPKTANHGSPV